MLSLDQESILPAEAAIGAGAGAEEEGSVRFSETVETSTGDGKTAEGRISGAREKKETPQARRARLMTVDTEGSPDHPDLFETLSERSKCDSFLWYIQTYSIPLLLGVVVGMCMANINETLYDDMRHFEVIPSKTFTIFGHVINIHFLINDMFMTFFFGIAAKEITEACLPGGSLNPPSKAANPLLATIGGAMGPIAVYFLSAMIFYRTDSFGAPSHSDFCAPVAAAADDGHRRLEAAAASSTPADADSCALGERWETALGTAGCEDAIESCLNSSSSTAAIAGVPVEQFEIPDYTWSMIANGWGIPTATDISLAWVVATVIFGAGHPAISFLLLLAVADDGLGLIIIAIFYPSPGHPFHGEWLLMIVLGMCTALLLRKLHVMYWSVYIALAGTMCWIGLLGAALHPALAFVFVVPFLPALHDDDEEENGEHSSGSGSGSGSGIAVSQELPEEEDFEEEHREDMRTQDTQQRLRAEVRGIFESLDLNKDGVLHVDEMEIYIRSLSAETTEMDSVEMLIANFHSDIHTYMDFNDSVHNNKKMAVVSPGSRKSRMSDADVVTFEEFYQWYEHTGGYHIQMVKSDLDHVTLFAEMNEIDKQVLAKAISFASTRGHNGHLHVYKKGDLIVQRGEEGHEMFIVHTGSCDALDVDGHIVQQYSAVSHPTSHAHTFGEVALLSSMKHKGEQGAFRSYSVVASEDTTVWSLGDHELRIAGRQIFNQVLAMAHAYHEAKDDEVYHDHAPLHMYEHHTKLFVDVGMFFFAWANAGVKVTGAGGMTWVVLASLLVGKIFGIVSMVRARLLALPPCSPACLAPYA